MINLKLEVIRFEEPDIIATSGVGMTASYFGDKVPNNGAFTFFGGSSGEEWHDAHEENIVSAFNSYFGWNWEDLGGITLNFADGYNRLDFLVIYDTDNYGDPSGNSKYSGTYTFNKNGEFDMRSN